MAARKKWTLICDCLDEEKNIYTMTHKMEIQGGHIFRCIAGELTVSGKGWPRLFVSMVSVNMVFVPNQKEGK